MMQRYGIWTLFALLVLTPAAGQTPDAAPVVRGVFRYGPDTCKKRCADDAACFKECTQHELSPDESPLWVTSHRAPPVPLLSTATPARFLHL